LSIQLTKPPHNHNFCVRICVPSSGDKMGRGVSIVSTCRLHRLLFKCYHLKAFRIPISILMTISSLIFSRTGCICLLKSWTQAQGVNPICTLESQTYPAKQPFAVDVHRKPRCLMYLACAVLLLFTLVWIVWCSWQILTSRSQKQAYMDIQLGVSPGSGSSYRYKWVVTQYPQTNKDSIFPGVSISWPKMAIVQTNLFISCLSDSVCLHSCLRVCVLTI